MAVLYTQHFVQFFDDNGDPLNGGKLYAYEAGTTTPKDTYTTAAGSVANANPVVLDSAGRATIFLNGTYKFVLKTSADVTIRTTDNVTAFATSFAGVSAITTDFTEDVIVAGDSIIFSDASDSNTTKRDTVQGILDLVVSSSGAKVLLKTETASASASITFINGASGVVFDSTYKEYEVEIIDLIPATDDTELWCRTTTNASSFDSGASDYAWVYSGRAAASTNLTGGDIADSEIEMASAGATEGVGNAAGESLNARIRIYNPAGTSNYKQITYDVSYMTAAGSGAIAQLQGVGTRLATADIDGIQFLMSSGNITSGTFKLYGIT